MLVQAYMNIAQDRARAHMVLQRAFGGSYSYLAQEKFYNNPVNRFWVLFITTQDGHIVGTVTVEWIGDLVGISNFGILPEYQRKGIGKAALAELRSIYGDICVIDCPEEELLTSIYKGMPIIFRD